MDKRKIRQTGCAALLTALLAVAATPAFADAGASGKQDFTDNQSTTTISVETDGSQLKATMPIAVTVVAPLSGGELLTPSAGTYAIANQSAFDIYVTGIKATAQGAWGIVTDDPAGAAPAVGTKGDLMLSLKDLMLDGTAQAITPAQAPAFTVPAKSAADGTLDLTLTGKGSQIVGLAEGMSEAAVQVVYTISATKPA